MGIVDPALHVLAAAIGGLAALLFWYAYRRMGAGHMSDSAKWLVVGIAVVSLTHALDNVDALLPFSLPFHFAHFIEVVGLSCLGFAGWELYLFSKNLGGGI